MQAEEAIHEHGLPSTFVRRGSRTSAPVDLVDFFQLLVECRYPLEELRYRQRARRLVDDPELQHNPLMSLVPMLVEPVYGPLTRWEVYEGMPIYDSSNTERALATSDDVVYQPLDHALLQRYLDYWIAIGFLDKARVRANDLDRDLVNEER